MESEDPLSQLADIHLPDPVSIWPLAPGWWLVIVLILAGLCWLSIQYIRKTILNRRLKAAQAELGGTTENLTSQSPMEVYQRQYQSYKNDELYWRQ